ncbi:hypothetical protein BROUX41_005923 [Berkeleyomyces rouxiae]|uniref:uncharacterized protein n=1 Tax=Berkeleyomyces rouxiae TaxID=2035830 RepID=UPI003B80C97D
MLQGLMFKYVKGKLQLIYLLPMVVCMAAFIMSMMCALAGTNKGVLEDMAVIRINTSRLGYFLVPSNSSDSDEDKENSDDGNFLDTITDTASDVADEAKDKLSEIGSDLVDKLAGELGIAQWYSLHLVSACQGNFTDDGLETSGCTESKANFRFSLAKEIGQQLSVGPLNLSLEDIGFSSSFSNGITRQLNHLLSFVFLVFVLYITGSIATGFSMLLSGALVVLAPGIADNKRAMVLRAAVVCSSVAAGCLANGTLVVWVASSQIAQTLTDFGEVIGLQASAGQVFMRMSLSSAVMMMGVFVMFFVEHRKPKIKAAAMKVRSRVGRRSKEEGGKAEETV